MPVHNEVRSVRAEMGLLAHVKTIRLLCLAVLCSHCDGAWALLVPGSSKLALPAKSPHILDIASTVCSVLRVEPDSLSGQPLLEPRTDAEPCVAVQSRP